MTKPNKTQQGFTLVELIIVMVVGSILAMMTTDILTLPVKAYVDSTRRATLTDAAEMAVRRMQRDIRRALPNSIRITGGGTGIELLHVVDGGRYRAKKASSCTPSDTASPCDSLKFTGVDTSFDVIGGLDECNSNCGDLVIYNVNSTSFSASVLDPNAYDGDNRSTITSITAPSPSATAGVSNRVIFGSNKFPLKSPEQRFFIVDTPITYSCVGNQLMRYTGYTIAEIPNLSTGTNAIQTKANSLICNFSYNTGSSARAGLVTISLILTDDANELIILIHQVHVDNNP